MNQWIASICISCIRCILQQYFKGVQIAGPGGTAPHFLHKIIYFALLWRLFTNQSTKEDRFSFFLYSKALKTRLWPMQVSRIQGISRTLVNRPLQFESHFDAPVFQYTPAYLSSFSHLPFIKLSQLLDEIHGKIPSSRQSRKYTT